MPMLYHNGKNILTSLIECQKPKDTLNKKKNKVLLLNKDLTIVSQMTLSERRQQAQVDFSSATAKTKCQN
jgi:hypothetical protein